VILCCHCEERSDEAISMALTTRHEMLRCARNDELLKMSSQLTIAGLKGVPLVKTGDDLAALALAAYADTGLVPEDGDVLVVAQKIVSKAEGRMVDVSTVEPSPQAVALAAEVEKDPRLVEVVLSESRRVVRHRPNLMIVEHRLGYVMANAGIDHSNVAPDDGTERVLLLPVDPDASADALRQQLAERTGKRIAIIISDSFGRPFRRGTVGIALGAAGLPAVIDWRGHPDLFGRKLEVTETGFADEIAAAASLVQGQADEATPIVLVRGLKWSAPDAPGAALVRPAEHDLFR
jgi:coenzyme F420-0:L-glutamate ligase/coenzyme F420-1:gamma-L-glutamate ligase